MICRSGWWFWASLVPVVVAIAGCDSGSGASTPPGVAGAASIAGAASTAGAVADAAPSAGSASIADSAGLAGAAGMVEYDTVPLSWNDGWLENAELGLRGAVFAESDTHTAQSFTSHLGGADGMVASACIQGTAARVDMTSEPCVNQTFTAPATDCFGEYWGAAIGMYLNQARDADSAEAGASMVFDGSRLKGFAFELDGSSVPRPGYLRFQIETEDRLFCNLRTVKIVRGENQLLFDELEEDCFLYPTDPPRPTVDSVQSDLLKISWHVLTNTESTVPFDLCVSNVRAILD